MADNSKIKKLQDGDGHWYWIPLADVPQFRIDLDRILGIEYLDDPEAFDDFSIRYSSFATGGSPDSVPFAFEK